MKKYRVWIGLAAFLLLLAYVARRRKEKADFNAMSVAINKAFGLYTVPVGNTLTQDVKVLKILFGNFERLGDGDMAKFAYIVATAYHESRFGESMREIGSDSYLKQYDYTTAKGKLLGNTKPNDYKDFKGRGFVQITGRSNYSKYAELTGIDIVAQPDLVATDLDLAGYIIVHGMMEGVFTGKKLSQYIGAYSIDFYNARRVVNGTDRAELIKGYAQEVYDLYRKELDDRAIA